MVQKKRNFNILNICVFFFKQKKNHYESFLKIIKRDKNMLQKKNVEYLNESLKFYSDIRMVVIRAFERDNSE